MRVLLAAVLIIATWAAFFMPAVAQAQTICDQRKVWVSRLLAGHGERPVAGGIGASGRNLLEIFAATGGTWTALVVLPDGRACYLASGTDWQVHDSENTKPPVGQGSGT